jgi:signal transduction histidine kinase
VSAPRLERVLAVGRAFLTVTGLAAIYLDPTEPARLAPLTYGILMAYATYSVVVLVWVHRGARMGPTHGPILQAADILWTSALTFVSDGPGSPFFLFFLFVVASSAYRWGFRGTVVTAGATAGIFVLETFAAAAGPWRDVLMPDPIEVNRTILRVAYLLLAGFLLGYLAEQEKQSRSELAAFADLSRAPRLDFGLRRSVTAIAESLLRSFDAREIAVVLQEHTGSAASLWRLRRHATEPATAQMQRQELDTEQLRKWLFPVAADSWHAEVTSTAGEAVFRFSETGAWPLRKNRGRLPTPLMASAVSTVTAANVGMPGEWNGRIYLFDIADTQGVERVVHFLDDTTRYLTPTMTNVFLLRQLRSRDTAAERARVARELHDGAVQALYGIDMKLEALRRRSGDDPAGHDRQLGEVQDVVRSEVRALRSLMQALRPIELDASEKLPDVLAGVVERFRRDSGVRARFVVEGDTPSLRPTAALEVVRIVQEALVNVRKHSQATNVFVRLVQVNGHHLLVVEDDGRGFDFEGSMTSAELDERRLGPMIIKERARMLEAGLVVHSTRGAGSRLEITFGGPTPG